MKDFSTQIILVLSLVLVVSCGGGGGDDVAYNSSPVVTSDEIAAKEYTYSGTGYGIEHVDTPISDSADAHISYTLNLGSTPKDVYFIFTNVTQEDTADNSFFADQQEMSVYERYSLAEAKSQEISSLARQNGIGLKGRTDVSLFNSNPELYSGLNFQPRPSAALFQGPPQAPLFDAVDDTTTFYPEAETSTTVAATCRKVVTANSKTLNIWVADNSWSLGSCDRTNCITQAMVDAMADKFLQTDAGTPNDIYEWITNIYGAEWGAHSDAELMTADDNITILLFDIFDDDSTTGGVLGYFWAKDNYKQSVLSYSNERIMFYVDSVLFATPEGATWEIADEFPDMLIGTLAHEFQHMIHFYQKQVRNTLSSSETWFNEMSSEVAEDFVAKELGIEGPRGVAADEPTAGSAGNTSGRLPRFNRFNYIPVSQWMDGEIYDPGDANVLNSYSVNYGFGAFLARNFGGAALFQNIAQNNKTDYTAINDALIAAGYPSETFATVMKKWGVGVLLSDDSSADVPATYRYNTGAAIDTTMGAITYSLGSINLFNYTDSVSGQVGPLIYDTFPPADANAGKYKASNTYFKVGTGLTGTIDRAVTVRKGTKLTVLVK